MPAAGPTSVFLHDLPVCFPGHPCVDYSPYEADAINLTSALTPASGAIAVACFAALCAAAVFVLLGLRPRSRTRLGGVALSTALVLVGGFLQSVAGLRLSAIAVIFGLEGPGSPDLFGSWPLVGMTGTAMVAAGVAGLAITATVAVLRTRDLISAQGAAEQHGVVAPGQSPS